MSLANREEAWPATRGAACTQHSSAAIHNAGNDDLLLRGFLQLPLLHVGGPRLDCLLELLRSALKKEFGEISETIPSKEFMRKCKVHFCIGVNQVTRTLERMPSACTSFSGKREGDKEVDGLIRNTRSPKGGKTISLQAVLVAADVHPRLLAGHLPGLAASRKVPCITISGGNGTGSLRLGEILGLRTAIAIGLKAGDSRVNKALECFLKDECG